MMKYIGMSFSNVDSTTQALEGNCKWDTLQSGGTYGNHHSVDNSPGGPPSGVGGWLGETAIGMQFSLSPKINTNAVV